MHVFHQQGFLADSKALQEKLGESFLLKNFSGNMPSVYFFFSFANHAELDAAGESVVLGLSD